jgi:hypothetical protein
MAKKIWIDGYEANVPQRLGSGQVAFELLKNLEKIDQENEYLILLPSEPMNDMPKARDKWQYKVLKPSKLWTRIALPLFLFRSKIKPDLFFSPTHYSPWLSPVKRVVTIFDLSYLHFPEMFQPKDSYVDVLLRFAKGTSKIAAVSNELNTLRRDLHNLATSLSAKKP